MKFHFHIFAKRTIREEQLRTKELVINFQFYLFEIAKEVPIWHVQNEDQLGESF